MPAGNDIVARTPDGVAHRFPAGTPDSVVDSAIQQYLQVPAPTQTQSQPAQSQPEGLATRIGRGAALGAAAGLGIPESPTPVRDLASGLNQQVNQAVGGWNRWSTRRTAPQVDK